MAAAWALLGFVLAGSVGLVIGVLVGDWWQRR